MTYTLAETLDAILRLCQRTVELGEKAVPSPWEHRSTEGETIYGPNPFEENRPELLAMLMWPCHKPAQTKDAENMWYDTASFIAHSRDFSPAAAKAVMVAIKAYNNLGPWSQSDSRPLMQAIASQFSEEMLKPYYES